MNAPTKIHLDVTISDPSTALSDIAKALADKLDVMSGKKLPDGVHRIDGTDLLYTFTSAVTHHDAPGAVAKLDQVPGYAPWDLAMPHEAIQLLDYDKYDPAVDTTKHPGIKSELAWLKPVYKSSSGYAWYVLFGTGGVGCRDRNSRLRALAVCRPVPASQ